MNKLKIPIKTLVNQSVHTSGFFLAKSGVCFKDFNEQNVRVSGFGFNQDKNNAIKSSQYETLEHLYALYSFQKTALCCEDNLTGLLWQNQDEKRVFTLPEILIGPYPYEVSKSADANGLGCHPSYNLAVDHSILELVERHLLSLIWYDNELIKEIKTNELKPDCTLTIRHYTLLNRQVPFVITILSELEKGFWILGSALRVSFAEAIKHSTNEALMLLEGSGIENGLTYSDDAKMRLNLLKNKEMSLFRSEFFSKKIKDESFVDLYRQYKINEIVNRVLENAPIWIVELYRNKDISVVRAICEECKNPRWLRHKANQFNIPLDPLC